MTRRGSISYSVSRDGQALAMTPDTSFTDAAAGNGSHSYTVAVVDRFVADRAEQRPAASAGPVRRLTGDPEGNLWDGDRPDASSW